MTKDPQFPAHHTEAGPLPPASLIQTRINEADTGLVDLKFHKNPDLENPDYLLVHIDLELPALRPRKVSPGPGRPKGIPNARTTLPFNETARRKFLELFAESGSVVMSAAAVGVSRQTIWNTRQSDAGFAEDYDNAMEFYRDLLGAEIHRRGVIGTLKPVYQKGKLVGYVREHSDRLLELHAKRHIHDYRDKIEVNHGDAMNDEKIQTALASLTPEGRREVRALLAREVKRQSGQGPVEQLPEAVVDAE